jgi:hypothetical protein
MDLYIHSSIHLHGIMLSEAPLFTTENETCQVYTCVLCGGNWVTDDVRIGFPLPRDRPVWCSVIKNVPVNIACELTWNHRLQVMVQTRREHTRPQLPSFIFVGK